MKPSRYRLEEEFEGNPSQEMGIPPELFNREAEPGDPWDASNEPDAYSPLMMIQSDAEDVSAEDNAELDGWIDAVAAGLLDPEEAKALARNR